MRYAIVVNPVSGRRQGEKIGVRSAQRLVEAGHEAVVVSGPDAAGTRDSLQVELKSGVDAVLVVGGDGALHELLPLLAHTGLPVGMLPAGTGNDLARSIGLDVKHADEALDVVLRGSTRTIDLAQVDDRLVATVVASGFDSKVNERANAMRWPRGNMRYNLAIVAELRSFQPLEFTLTLDTGEKITRHAMLAAVGNGPSFGGGLRLCEGAVMDDGLLDLVVINPVGKLKLLRVFPQLYQGTHTSLPQFERFLVRSVTLDSPGIVAYGDGERLGPLPQTVAIRPAALTVYVP